LTPILAQANEAIPLGYWFAFGVLVTFFLFLDLAVFNRKAHVIRPTEALWTTAIWVILALGFCVWIALGPGPRFGPEKALQFLTGYIIEEALSVDNLFVFVVIFRYFAVRPEYQHRILFWGILGAVVMRLLFVLAGTGLIRLFHPVIYIFGAFLIYTAWKLLAQKDAEMDPGKNLAMRLFRRTFPTVTEFEGPRFFVRRDGKSHATPLLLVLVVVETTDLLFAVDSVPAILAITTDTFIVFTSNIFAILGLRSVYFLLSGMMEAFRFLKVGLSLILAFVGVKMLISGWYDISVGISLGVVAAILATSVLASLVPQRGIEPRREAPPPDEES
jgi:tellurite resistance protein TerC